jgi:hypothetical protein
MYALGDPHVLEDLFKRVGFLNVSVRALAIQWRFHSAASQDIATGKVAQVTGATG